MKYVFFLMFLIIVAGCTLDKQNTLLNNVVYGEATYHNHDGVIINFAVSSLNYNLTFNDSMVYGFVFNDTENSLTTQISGIYSVCHFASGSGQNNHIYFQSISINGINEEKCECHKKMSAGGDITTLNGCCIVSLNKNDEIKLIISDETGTGTGTYYASNLNIRKIK